MPAYTEVDLNEEDLNAIFVFLFAARATIDIEDIRPAPTTSTTTTAAPGDVGDAAPTFTEVVAPILRTHCAACHGSLGGWDASSFDAAMTTGDHGPVIIAGDPAASLLVQKIQGTQAEGLQMPPPGLMSERDIQAIVDWITAGASR